MNKCSNCGHENRAGEILCQKCGTNLITGVKPQSTKRFDEQAKQQLAESMGEKVVTEASQSGTMFPENATLRLQIIGSPLPVNVKFTKRVLTIGRRDPATGSMPDIDLAPFAGYRMGVSRRHTEVRHNPEGFLEVIDLGSSNGTFLNGQRMLAHTPYRLNDRDRLALGQIVLEVSFLREGEHKATGPLGQGGTKPLPPLAASSPSPATPSTTAIIMPSTLGELPGTAMLKSTEKAPDAHMQGSLGTNSTETVSLKEDAKPVGEPVPAKSQETGSDELKSMPLTGTVTQTKINPAEILKQAQEAEDEGLTGVSTQPTLKPVQLSDEERKAIFGKLDETASDDKSDGTDKPQ